MAKREFLLTEADFRFIVKLVHDKTGIVLADHKRDMVYSRLARRLRAFGFKDFKEYIALLQSPEVDDELHNLVNATTTNLTRLFREEHHFDHLKNQVLAPLLKKSVDKKLRIWSAGCSSGMEPYSIAMTVHSVFQNRKDWDIKILATDIDTNMLDTGRAGIYKGDDYEHIPAAYRGMVEKITINGQNHIEMSDALKEMIHFKQLNLLEPWPMKGKFDALFCRNVVIYFDKPTQAKLFNRYADHLKPSAHLYIGHSESLFSICDRFKLIGQTIYELKK